MTKAKRRYYWLKLKEDFFVDIRMKRLRKLSGGDTYTIIYLKLLLLSLRDEGKLYFERVDENFVKELALVIDETEDDIQVTLRYLQGVGLLEIISEDEYFLTELPTLIGSETDWAVKKRKYREQRKELMDKERTLSLVSPTDVRQEIEKEIDIELEKEREGEIEEKIGLPVVNQLSTNGQPSIDKSSVDKNRLDKDSEEETRPLTFYGVFQNVNLSDHEYKVLQDQLSGHTQTMIDKLSRYMQSSGKIYKSHYATILSWYEEDKDKLAHNKRSSIPTIEDYNEGDYL